MRELLAELARRDLPVFGVCLGLQGIVEFCGGKLARLATPVHGKASVITCEPSVMFEGLPRELRVGRYHSLYAAPESFPEAELTIQARTQDGCVMAVSHRKRPWTAVQFHPESILSADGDYGHQLIRNVVRLSRARVG
jgi:anthranilate synthase